MEDSSGFDGHGYSHNVAVVRVTQVKRGDPFKNFYCAYHAWFISHYCGYCYILWIRFQDSDDYRWRDIHRPCTHRIWLGPRVSFSCNRRCTHHIPDHRLTSRYRDSLEAKRTQE